MGRAINLRRGRAFAGELIMWDFFVAMVICTIALNIRLTGLLIVGVLVVHYLQRYVRKAHRLPNGISR